ncbi:TPA: hypothetical protein DF272_02075 [Candidatus Falkowbacteria bacterium]|nr:hypothetical protein [Candidatus Falkowbacteria bacterium]
MGHHEIYETRSGVMTGGLTFIALLMIVLAVVLGVSSDGADQESKMEDIDTIYRNSTINSANRLQIWKQEFSYDTEMSTDSLYQPKIELTNEQRRKLPALQNRKSAEYPLPSDGRIVYEAQYAIAENRLCISVLVEISSENYTFFIIYLEPHEHTAKLISFYKESITDGTVGLEFLDKAVSTLVTYRPRLTREQTAQLLLSATDFTKGALSKML